jgi:hypothetical protein
MFVSKSGLARAILLSIAVAFLIFSAAIENTPPLHAQTPTPAYGLYINFPMGLPQYACVGQPINIVFGVGYRTSGDNPLAPLTDGVAKADGTTGTFSQHEWSWSPGAGPTFLDLIWTPNKTGQAILSFSVELGSAITARESKPFPIIDCSYHIKFESKRTLTATSSVGTLTATPTEFTGEGDIEILNGGIVASLTDDFDIRGSGKGTMNAGNVYAGGGGGWSCRPLSAGGGIGDFRITGTYNTASQILKVDIDLGGIDIGGVSWGCTGPDGKEYDSSTTINWSPTSVNMRGIEFGPSDTRVTRSAPSIERFSFEGGSIEELEEATFNLKRNWE